MKLYDADNQYLGILLGSERGPIVYIPSLDMVVTLQDDETETPKWKYSDVPAEPFYYLVTDCDGDPYGYGANGNARIIFRKGGTNNYYGLDIEKTSCRVFTPSSYMDDSGTCHNDCGPEGEAFYIRLQFVTLPFSTPVKHPYKWEITESKSRVVVIPLGD
jgi:hypothetical protein